MADEHVLHNTRPIANGVVAKPAGEIGFARSPLLRIELMQLIDQHKPQRLILDMADVPYMDSSGVATLVEAMQLQRQRHGKLILCAMQDRVRSVFEIAKLDLVFTIVADLDSATKA